MSCRMTILSKLETNRIRRKKNRSLYLVVRIDVEEWFSNLIDSPMDDHENDIDIEHVLEDSIDEEWDVIEEFSRRDNRYSRREMDDTIDTKIHLVIEWTELNPIT